MKTATKVFFTLSEPYLYGVNDRPIFFTKTKHSGFCDLLFLFGHISQKPHIAITLAHKQANAESNHREV